MSSARPGDAPSHANGGVVAVRACDAPPAYPPRDARVLAGALPSAGPVVVDAGARAPGSSRGATRSDVVTTTLTSISGRRSRAARGRRRRRRSASTTWRRPFATAGWASRRRCRGRAAAPRPARTSSHVFGVPRPDHDRAIAGLVPRQRGVPYVFEPLGMFRPRLREGAAQAGARRRRSAAASPRAARPPWSSPRSCEGDVVALRGPGRSAHRWRGNGVPRPAATRADGDLLRARARRPGDAPLVLYVGRIAGREGDRAPARGRRGALPGRRTLVLAGPDDRHGTMAAVARRGAHAAGAERGSTSSRHARASARRSTPTPTSSSSPRAERASAWSPPRRPPQERP